MTNRTAPQGNMNEKTKAQFTAGPWFKRGAAILTSDDDLVAQVIDGDIFERDANARLIVQAPRMAEFIERIARRADVEAPEILQADAEEILAAIRGER